MLKLAEFPIAAIEFGGDTFERMQSACHCMRRISGGLARKQLQGRDLRRVSDRRRRTACDMAVDDLQPCHRDFVEDRHQHGAFDSGSCARQTPQVVDGQQSTGASRL